MIYFIVWQLIHSFIHNFNYKDYIITVNAIKWKFVKTHFQFPLITLGSLTVKILVLNKT